MPQEMLLFESGAAGRRAVQDDVDVVIPCFPGVFEKPRRLACEIRAHGISQPIESCTQGSAPFLSPALMTARITSAVHRPAAQAVYATPGSVFEDLDLMLGRVHF